MKLSHSVLSFVAAGCCLTGVASAGDIELASDLVVDGLSSSLFATHAGDGSNRLFIVEQAGRIRIFDLNSDTLLTTPFLNIVGPVLSGGERGLLGLAFHPDYAANGFFYVNYTNDTGATVVSRFEVSGDPDIADAASEQIVLTIAQPFENHNGGWIGFGPDDFLYIATGDGGAGNDPGNRSQDITNQLLGKLLRVDVDGDDFPADTTRNYAIPPTNPFVGVTGDDEIWAYGLRNPWRCAFDRQTGDLYIADVGQNAWEEVDVQPAGVGGLNYGWRCMEGNNCTGLSGCVCMDAALTDPVHEYDHGDGFSIAGGYVYRGSDIAGFEGTYVFADTGTNRIWTFKWDGGGGITDFREVTADLSPAISGGSLSTIVSFGEDEAGEMYAVSLEGKVFKIIAGPPVNDECVVASLAAAGDNTFTTVNAAPTPGVTEPCATLDADVWFRFVMPEAGTFSAEICDADFDAQLALYNFGCPSAPDTALACSDNDGCGAAVSFEAPAPGLYRLRIGSEDGATGTGTLSITIGVPPCPWDCAPRGGNGEVNFDDLVVVVNAITTQDLACDVAPDNGDGTFGNGIITFDDLIAVINNFGSCPN